MDMRGFYDLPLASIGVVGEPLQSGCIAALALDSLERWLAHFRILAKEQFDVAIETSFLSRSDESCLLSARDSRAERPSRARRQVTSVHRSLDIRIAPRYLAGALRSARGDGISKHLLSLVSVLPIFKPD